MVPHRSPQQAESAHGSDIGADAMAFLNHLRFVAMKCRAKPRTQLFEACAALLASKPAKREAYAEVLMQCLNQALGKSVRLYAPGTAEMTFDESWLVQLGRACLNDDEASRQFLLGSRVAPEHRRLLGFLAGHAALAFASN